MLLGGDEMRRTQGGNNNAYNQDNATSWFDWTMADTNQDVLRYVRRMIAFRKANPPLRQPHFYRGEVNERGLADITWHGTKSGNPGFDDPDGRALACTIAGFGGDADLHVMMNMFWEPLAFEVPIDPQRTWHVAVDTFLPSPHDIPDPNQGPALARSLCTVQGRSIVILVGVV
jgi:isoamylase